ncbi:leukocyte elastase inhibitor-like [Planococcus citri]|uniref:leukocyte elastase inhibitor-like n=1 Tax=Planococcus citri TaxID=170843 RepID=UPI0031FA3FA2
MWGKISIFFAIGLLQLEAACTNSRSSPPTLSIQQKIQNDILDNIHAHDDFLLKITPLAQNIQFIPLSAEVSVNIFKLKYYYESDLALYFTKDEYLNQTYFLSSLTDTLQKSSDVKLEVNNVIFYDRENTSQPFLDDAKKYYHAELHNVSFDPTDNETLLVSINQWIAKNTKNRAQKLYHLTTKGKSYLQVSLLSYTACWDKPKTSTNSIKTLNFKIPHQEKIKIQAFNSKEKIGYYNNSKLKYEAIRLPYKNNEFAMIIMLPYPDQQLKSVSNFSTAQYLHLFGNVSAHQENIDYTIPSINLPMISLNENGTAVNGEDLIVCDSFPVQQSLVNGNKTDYKTFYVDRPFGIYVYNEKTKIVLVHSWIKNPISSLSTVGSSPRQNSDVLLIQSSNLYEIFHMLL